MGEEPVETEKPDVHSGPKMQRLQIQARFSICQLQRSTFNLQINVVDMNTI